MNNTDRQYLEARFGCIKQKLDRVHDDVLIIKTERRMEKKHVGYIAAGVSLIVSVAALFLRR